MAASPDPGSSSSTIGLSSISINKSRVLPEQWTLPTEWNIEKREMYDNWKLDLQCQIAHLDKQLHQATSSCPQEALGVYEPRVTMYEEARLQTARADLRGTMQKGVRR